MENELKKDVFVSMYKDLLDRVSDRLAWEIKQKGKESDIVKGAKAIYIFNLNFHYVIQTSSSFAIYPLVGFTYAHYKYDDKLVSGSTDRCGANVGMGAQYQIKDGLHFFTETRFQIMKDYNQSVTLLGLKYTF